MIYYVIAGVSLWEVWPLGVALVAALFEGMGFPRAMPLSIEVRIPTSCGCKV